jgi:hypothetical protein
MDTQNALMKPGANVIKLFTVVIYHHSMAIQSFCVIKLKYLGNYLGIAANYHGILTLEKNRVKPDKHSSLVRKSVNHGQKKFYNIGPRGVYFKTFCRCNS